MTTLEQPTATLGRPADVTPFDEAQPAAGAFLARYIGRTLEANRHDLRAFFQWASDNRLLVLNARRPHIELYGARWKHGVWQRPRSTVACRRCVASTARSHRRTNRSEPGPVRPSTQGPASEGHDWTAPSWRLDRRTAHRWVCATGKRAGLGVVHPHLLRAGLIMATLDAGVPLRDVQIVARHADPGTTTIYDRRRENFDRHVAYVVVAFVAGG